MTSGGIDRNFLLVMFDCNCNIYASVKVATAVIDVLIYRLILSFYYNWLGTLRNPVNMPAIYFLGNNN